MWKCKECGCTTFKKTIITTTEVLVTFDEDGKEEEKEVDQSNECYLECKNCGKSSSIFNFIEDIAEWEE
ncbi:hypothetical protein [Fusobacterium sp. SYSU M8A802]